MKREYHPYWYRLDGIDDFLIWVYDELDVFFQTSDKNIPSFSNLRDLVSVATHHNLKVSVETPILLDLTLVTDWLEKPSAERINCSAFLNA